MVIISAYFPVALMLTIFKRPLLASPLSLDFNLIVKRESCIIWLKNLHTLISDFFFAKAKNLEQKSTFWETSWLMFDRLILKMVDYSILLVYFSAKLKSKHCRANTPLPPSGSLKAVSITISLLASFIVHFLVVLIIPFLSKWTSCTLVLFKTSYK